MMTMMDRWRTGDDGERWMNKDFDGYDESMQGVPYFMNQKQNSMNTI